MTLGPDFYPHKEGESEARRIALDIFNALAFRAQDTARFHAQLSDTFWGSTASPDEILKEMGKEARTWVETARAHVKHIAEVSASMKVDFKDLLKPEHLSPPREATVNADGTATLAK